MPRCRGARQAEPPWEDVRRLGRRNGGNVFEADLYPFPVTGFSASNPPNTPAPTVVFSENAEEADSHGATVTQRKDFLWVADRGRNFIWVVKTGTDEIVNRIQIAGSISADPTPDLLVISPGGHRIFASLRGPNPLTADPHLSTGSTPGLGVFDVHAGGREGQLVAIAPVSNVGAPAWSGPTSTPLQ
jgi:hypothetical protein